MINDDSEPSRTMVAFLLGELPEDERLRFEDQMTQDTNLFYSVAELQNDLFDLYASEKLTGEEKRRLESWFLAGPRRRSRLAFARALAAHPGNETSDAAPAANPRASLGPFQIGATAAVFAAILLLISAIGISWLLLANRGLRAEVESLREQKTTSSQKLAALQRQLDTLAKELHDSSSEAGQPLPETPHDREEISFTLADAALRSGGASFKMRIPAGARAAFLHAVFSADSLSIYHVVLENAEGNQIWRQERAKAERIDATQKQVVVRIPARLLSSGDYILHVTGDNGQQPFDIAAYSFSVVRE